MTFIDIDIDSHEYSYGGGLV